MLNDLLGNISGIACAHSGSPVNLKNNFIAPWFSPSLTLFLLLL